MAKATRETKSKAGGVVVLDAAKGGRARAAALSPDERRSIAQRAADVRWAASSGSSGAGGRGPRVPRATHVGVLKIGEYEFQCAVLEDGRRVLTQDAFGKAIGRTGNPNRGPGESSEVPPFLAATSLKPFISEELKASSKPIKFRLRTSAGVSGGLALGYAAELLPQVCRVFLDARDAGALHPTQQRVARVSDLLVRALATVGIVALVDEATGYQRERERNELERILALFISKELLTYTKRFPDEFFKQMFRLQGWSFNPLSMQGPRYAGKLVNKLVYERLPPGVLEELRARNPVVPELGARRHHHHQLLAPDLGQPVLSAHVAQVTAMMRGSKDWEQFNEIFERAFPKPGDQIRLGLGDGERAEAAETTEKATEKVPRSDGNR